MKQQVVVSGSLLAVVLLSFIKLAHAGGAGGPGVPLSKLAGSWAGAGEGSYGLCFNSTFTALQDCTGDTNVAYYTQSFTISETLDKDGNECSELVGANSPWFPNPVTPANAFDIIDVGKVTSYDQTIGSGEASFTNYTAGAGTSCNGSVLVNSANSPAIGAGTTHFVVSGKGGRIDVSTLTDTNPGNSVGDDTTHAFIVRQ